MNTKELCEALCKALDLEVDGYEFYSACAEHTSSEKGKEMFNYLADEERVHYDRVEEIYKSKFGGRCIEYTSRSDRETSKSSVFEEKVPGGNLDEKSDALDALNIGIKVEDNSIELYRQLAEESKDPEINSFFAKLVKEEEKHRQILENEVELVTETGNFTDFKVVTT